VKEQTVIGALISWNEEGILEYSEYQKMWSLVEEGDASRTKNGANSYLIGEWKLTTIQLRHSK
jgi:hypothetical protein